MRPRKPMYNVVMSSWKHNKITGQKTTITGQKTTITGQKTTITDQKTT